MLDFLVEQRLEDAVSRGELSNLPGEGRPLELDDDPLIPEELRLAYRILKNANLLNQDSEDADSRPKALRKLALLKTRIENRYYEKALAKLGR